jgi:hypothetical protein
MANNNTTTVIVNDELSLDIRVGWASPHLTNEESIYFNFHVTIDDSAWHETIEYGALFELKNTMQLYRVPIDLTTFPNLSDDYEMIANMMKERIFIIENLKMLDKMSKALENWVRDIFLNLPKLDEKSIRIMKQLFFNNKIKMLKFDELVRLTTSEKTETATTKKSTTSGATRRASVAGVFNTMSNMINSSLHPTTGPKLNSANLEKLAGKGGSGGTSVAGGGVGARGGGAKSVVSDTHHLRGHVAGKEKNSLGYFGFGGAKSKKGSEDGSNEDASGNPTALDIVNNSLLLTTEVCRGQESQAGLVIYDIILKVTGKKFKTPMIFIAHQRYSMFQKLYIKLCDINKTLSTTNTGQTPVNSASKDSNGQGDTGGTSANKLSPYADFIHLISAPFPSLPMKCYLGISLNESELSQRYAFPLSSSCPAYTNSAFVYRTRMLDSWFRDVCYYYKNFPNAARQEIREFLKFDMSQPNDIFFQDQLAWGTIESNKKTHTPVLIIQQSVLDNMSPELQDEIETMTAVDAKETGSVLGGGGGGAGSAVRRGSVRPGGGPKKAGSVHNGLTGLGRVEEDGGERSNHLQSLIWETASVGGVSKIPKQDAAKLSRSAYKEYT